MTQPDIYGTQWDPTGDYRTPRPWQVGKNGASVVADDAPHGVLHLAVGQHTRSANARFIVQACNSHDELVAALRNLYELVAEREQDNHDLGEGLDAAEAALAAAKGGGSNGS